MKISNSLIYTLKKYLLTWVYIFFIIGVLIFGVSWFFPKKIPFIDTMRVSMQKSLLSSISTLRYPNVSAHEEETEKYVLKNVKWILLPWDIIFSYRAWFITNDLIEGKRKHASVYLWDKDAVKKSIQKNNLSALIEQSVFDQRNNTDMIIIDSTEHGVTIRSLEDLTYLDDILVVRTEKSWAQIQKMITTLIEQLGKPYNYDFDINDTSSIYCAQLIHQGLTAVNINIPYTSFVWRAYLYPQDIVDYIFSSGIQKEEFSIVIAIKNMQSNLKYYYYDDILKAQIQKKNQ